MNIIKSKKAKSSKKKSNHQKIKKEINSKLNNKESENPVNQEKKPDNQEPEPFKLDSKNECIKLIKESIETYINKNNVHYDEKEYHYKKWLEIFSKDDYKNEYENQESGIFYNTVYHQIWDSFFQYNDFIIINHH